MNPIHEEEDDDAALPITEGEPRLDPIIHVPDDAIGLRVDTFLARLPGAPSRNRVQQLVKDGHVTVDGKVLKPSQVISGGEVVHVAWPGPTDDWPWPQEIPLDIVHHDDDVIVVNKQADLVVHPSGGHPDGTLVNGLLHLFPALPGINGVRRPGIVHRLDRDTTGLIVAAKTDRAMSSLAKQFLNKSVRRSYLALVIGMPTWDTTTIDAPIGRDPVNRLKRSIGGGFARDARSHFEVLLRSHQFALIRCVLETGRTHQIRIHLKHAGFPIVCDEIYDGHVNRCLERLKNTQFELKTGLVRFNRPFLHSHTLSFYHPTSNKVVNFAAPPPQDARELLEIIFGEEAAPICGERIVNV